MFYVVTFYDATFRRKGGHMTQLKYHVTGENEQTTYEARSIGGCRCTGIEYDHDLFYLDMNRILTTVKSLI